jgi:hydroxymethylpyrimidine/phosphomethylpyrimidine kinase
MGARNVVIKGGHLRGPAIDLLYDGETYDEIEQPRIETPNTHGTGCTFASAIATLLAKGSSVPEAVRGAKTLITEAIRAGLKLGKGVGPTNPFASALRDMERYRIIQELTKAVEKMKEARIGHLIPEVGSNLGYALSDAEGLDGVAAFPGRIVRYKESIAVLGSPEFGVSQHVASIILTVKTFHPDYGSAMNIRYSKEQLVRLQKKGFLLASFDRRLEPKRVKEEEGSSLEWGVREVLKRSRRVPDFIWDKGDVGKEPMIRVLGRNPQEVLSKVLEAA